MPVKKVLKHALRLYSCRLLHIVLISTRKHKSVFFPSRLIQPTIWWNYEEKSREFLIMLQGFNGYLSVMACLLLVLGVALMAFMVFFSWPRFRTKSPWVPLSALTGQSGTTLVPRQQHEKDSQSWKRFQVQFIYEQSNCSSESVGGVEGYTQQEHTKVTRCCSTLAISHNKSIDVYEVTFYGAALCFTLSDKKYRVSCPVSVTNIYLNTSITT